MVALQYNPDTLTRTLQVQGIANEPGDRLEALRLKGPPIETIKLDAELDATDQLEHPDGAGKTASQYGLFPALAALETLVYPPLAQLKQNNVDATHGTMEILPLELPLTLFVWSKNRIVPVRLTEMTVTEEAFDSMLNPTRAKVSLSMRVLSVTDLGYLHKGGNMYLDYQAQKERFSQMVNGNLANLGLKGLP